MRPRPRRRALGLRGRIVGAVLVTTVATLGVAAVALLGPLQHELRNSARATLARDLGHGAARSFKKLDLTYVLDTAEGDRNSGVSAPGVHNTGPGAAQRAALQASEQFLSKRLGATVTLFGYPDAAGVGKRVPTADGAVDQAGADDDVRAAFRTHHTIKSFGSVDGSEVARVALPLNNGGHWYVLAVRRPITEVAGAVHVVRTAFITAVLAGLALTLILGIPLAATLVRRLRRLRQAALQLADPRRSVEVPVDRARDEVGDLARTFAIMQERLRHQEQARRAFVATASHELRTPLTSLDGMLELLDDDLRTGAPDIEDARSLLDRARAQSRRLGRLAGDLLDLSRLDAEVQLRSEPVELGELSRAVMAEFELGTSERGIISALEETAGPVWVLGDPGSAARILRILLDNSVRMSPQGGHITVELRGEPEPSLSVCDEGPGVPLVERTMIFERFQRGRDTAGQAGFGLGLAIGRELAERMGGTLAIEDSPGPGAKFTLRLPGAHAPEEDVVAFA
ncbi:MAG: HAMP domain-containing sensor histidine kinase [Solirubrobacteraceae bacterium]